MFRYCLHKINVTLLETRIEILQVKEIVMSEQEYKNIIQNLVVPETLTDEEKGKKYQLLLDYLRSNTPSSLFRFRVFKERTIDEFDKDIFGFAPASKMNDDFDGMLFFDKEQIKSSFTGSGVQQIINEIVDSARKGVILEKTKHFFSEEVLQQFINSLSNLTPEMISLLENQFVNFATEDYDKRMFFISQVVQDQKIASLSENIESAAMWGYYANNGTGFALSYDFREPNYSDYLLAPVIYGEERLNGTDYTGWLFQQTLLQKILIPIGGYALYSSFQHVILNPDEFMNKKVLLYKANVWQHEKEWRLVYNEKKGQDNTYPNIIKRPSAIYLGRNISPIHEKILRHIAVEKNIPAYKMMIKQDDRTYNLYPRMI